MSVEFNDKVKVFKAGKLKIVSYQHPDTKRAYRLPYKPHIKNKKRREIRMKQFKRLLPKDTIRKINGEDNG